MRRDSGLDSVIQVAIALREVNLIDVNPNWSVHVSGRRSGVVAILAAVAIVSAPATAALAQQTVTRIQAISIAPRGSDAVVTVSADGVLPAPTVGVLDGPPRIYLDFVNVRTSAAATTQSTDARIRRVRIGVNSVQPLVTRVVVDLHAPQMHRLEQQPGVVRIVIGTAASGPATAAVTVPALPEPAAPRAAPPPPPRRETPPPPPPTSGPLPAVAPSVPAPESAPSPASPAPPTPVMALVPPLPPPANKPPAAPPPTAPRASFSPPAHPPPNKDIERYRRQVATALDRLKLQQPLLASLDANEQMTAERVRMAIEEFERLRQELVPIKAPDTLRAQHDMLIQASTLGLMAGRLRLESLRTADANAQRNAASAAAGAIILLDRACADLGCLVQSP